MLCCAIYQIRHGQVRTRDIWGKGSQMLYFSLKSLFWVGHYYHLIILVIFSPWWQEKSYQMNNCNCSLSIHFSFLNSDVIHMHACTVAYSCLVRLSLCCEGILVCKLKHCLKITCSNIHQLLASTMNTSSNIAIEEVQYCFAKLNLNS